MTRGLSKDEINTLKTRTARLSIYSNVTLVIIKLIVGVITGSVSIISEALHSGNDLVAAGMAYFSIRKASQPADREHHFGHGKFESVSGAVEALLIFAVAVSIIYTALQKISSGSHMVIGIGWGLAVMLTSVILNYLVSQRLMQVAHQTGSVALEADAWHLRADVYTSLGVLAGLALIAVTGLQMLDPIVAILVALWITRAAYGITREALGHLLDVALPVEEQQQIIQLVESYYPKALSIHDLRTRRSGSDRYIDLHLVVARDTPVEEAHNLCDQLEARIDEMLPGTNVLIHLEPGDPPGKNESI